MRIQQTLSRSILGLFSLSALGIAHAEEMHSWWQNFSSVMEYGKASTLIDIDNDTLLLNRSDRFYTSGVRITRQYAEKESSGLRTVGWRIGQEIYTPSDIKLPPSQVGPPDHPYAGWLYGGIFSKIERPDGAESTFGLDVGCLGPCSGGEWVQTNLHRLIHQPLPQGWSKQVKNEVGVVAYADIAPVRWTLFPSMDVTPYVHGRFGNIYTDAGAGLVMRIGQLQGALEQSKSHAFMRLDTRAVAYNASLQGGYFSHDNPHTVNPKRWVGEAEIGFAWRNSNYVIIAAVVRRSNEISDLSNALGAQNYARLQFSYTP